MLKSIIVLFFSVLISGCATYQSKVAPSRDLLSQGNCDGALSTLEQLSQVQDGDQLVYLMDYGSALQACGQFDLSNRIFLQAERLSEAQDYNSVSRIAGATFFNEEMIQYKGDTFEKLFLNVSLALNFIQLGKLDSAMVEVRKINIKFNKLKLDDKRAFELNSFSKYLAGVIYESQKQYDDACIAYKESYALDTNYPQVASDMLRACWRAKRFDEFTTITKKMGATAEQIAAAKTDPNSEAIIIFMQGWGPRKTPRPEARTFPRLVPVQSLTSALQISTTSGTQTSETVYSFEDAAIRTLDADYASLVARRIGSRVAKEVMADQLRQKNEALGAVAWVAMVASERADLRQWSLYPRTMQVARVPLRKGLNELSVVGLTSSGSVSESFPKISVSAGTSSQRLFVLRSLR